MSLARCHAPCPASISSPLSLRRRQRKVVHLAHRDRVADSRCDLSRLQPASTPARVGIKARNRHQQVLESTLSAATYLESRVMKASSCSSSWMSDGVRAWTWKPTALWRLMGQIWLITDITLLTLTHLAQSSLTSDHPVLDPCTQCMPLTRSSPLFTCYNVLRHSSCGNLIRHV